MPRIILASASPRRKNLLSRLVHSFDIASSAVEEEKSDLAPPVPFPHLPLPHGYPVLVDDDPRLWAWRKAIDIARSDPYRIEPCLILGADTVVVTRQQVLGKPGDREEACAMLRLLRGTDHLVVTGFALLANHAGKTTTLHSAAEITRVVMRDFSEAELQGYVATGEPLDKAGAYALQGEGGLLVAEVEGCATNVVGLPLCRLRTLLKEAGTELLPYPAQGYCTFCLSRPSFT